MSVNLSTIYLIIAIAFTGIWFWNFYNQWQLSRIIKRTKALWTEEDNHP